MDLDLNTIYTFFPRFRPKCVVVLEGREIQGCMYVCMTHIYVPILRILASPTYDFAACGW